MHLVELVPYLKIIIGHVVPHPQKIKVNVFRWLLKLDEDDKVLPMVKCLVSAHASYNWSLLIFHLYFPLVFLGKGKAL